MRSRSRAMGGFTLIEILLATVLLAAGMALAFAAVRSTLAVSTRGETIASGNERMRAVDGFLRRRLSAAMPLAIGAVDPETGTAPVFIGDARHLQFVAEVPDYLGRGGPYLHELEVQDDGQALRLTVSLTLLQAGMRIEEQPVRGAELLVDGLKAVRLRYRGRDPRTGALMDWQEQWATPARLPVLVSIEIIPQQGPAWPPLLVAPPQYGRAGGWR
jgi:general secretion pathway protein J